MTKQRFETFLKKFRSTRILVMGDLILDEFIWGKVDRISPEAPVPVVWAERESVMPGGAANVATNVKALGGQVRLLGVVGSDSSGERLLRELKGSQIPTDDILTDSSRPTTAKTRVIAHHQQVVRIDRERVLPLSARLNRALIQRALRILPEVEGVIIEDYGKGAIGRELLKPVVAQAKRLGKVITVDPKEEHFDTYRGVTALTPNKKEASLAAGLEITDRASLKRAAQIILKRLKPEVLLVTLGEEGMCLFASNGARPVHIPTVAREVFDVSGAGDTVISVFTLALGAGATSLEAATIANAAAGVVVGKVGTATCSADELRNVILA